MIEENALIVHTEKDIAWVETERKSTCTSCSVKKGCGTSVLQKVLGQKRTQLQVLNPNHYMVGDTVVLGMQEIALLKGSLLLYGLPLLFMFLGAVTGYAIFFLYDLQYGELPKIFFSLSGLVIGFVYVAKFNRNIKNDPAYQAVILRKADESLITLAKN